MFNKIKTISLLLISIIYNNNLISNADKTSLKLISDKIKDAKNEISLNNIIKALIMFEQTLNKEQKSDEKEEDIDTDIIYNFIKKISKITNDRKYLNKIEKIHHNPQKHHEVISIFREYTVHLENYFIKINKQELKYNEISEVLDTMFETIAKLPKTNNSFNDKLFNLKQKLESTNNIKNIKKLKESIINVVSDIQTEIKDFNSNMNKILEENIKFANSKIKALEVKVDQVVNESYTDALTNALNRKWFDENFDELFWFEKNSSNSFLILDIDYFKAVNDTYGHDIGDVVLKEVVKRFKNTLRGNKEDKVIRYGGDEFILILVDVREDNLPSVLNRLLESINSKVVKTANNSINLTISIGASMFNQANSPEELFKLTDQKLYKAKENGRNCFIKEI